MEFFPAHLEKRSNVRATDFLDDIFAEGYTATILRSAEMVSAKGPEDGAGEESLTEAADAEPAMALSTAQVMEIWMQQCTKPGDDASAYLDIAWIYPSEIS
jgi:hypothetical protein